MTDSGPYILSVAVLACFALVIAAIVLLGNVLLWAWPMPPARPGGAAASTPQR